MVLYLCNSDLDGRSTAFRFSHKEGSPCLTGVSEFLETTGLRTAR
jgi:hypothetical protein